MYVDASAACNRLSVQLGRTAVGLTSLANRQWSIKVRKLQVKRDCIDSIEPDISLVGRMFCVVPERFPNV